MARSATGPYHPLKKTAAGPARSKAQGVGVRASLPPLESVILELQRTAGNGAVADLLSGKAAGGPWFRTTLFRAPDSGAALAASSDRGMESILLEKVVSGGKRPLDLAVLVPPAGVQTGPVSVLLHLHGISIFEGHRYEQMIHKGVIPPEFQMESQLQALAVANPKTRMIAVLPAGKTVPAGEKSYNVDFGGFDTDTLVDQAVKRLTAIGRLPAGSTAGGVTVSAHSGGGFAAKQAARGKKVTGMLAFESIHGDLDEYRKLLIGHLDTDLSELKAIADRPGLSADQAFTAQKQYLTERGFRFAGFAGSNKGYRERFNQLDLAIHGPGGWVDKHATALEHASGAHYPEIRALLEANYQFDVQKSGDHFKVMQGNLAKALGGPMPVAAPIIHAEKPGAAKAAAPVKQPPPPAPAEKKKPKRRHRTSTGPIAIPEGAIRSDRLPSFGGAETTAFMKAVYDKEQQIYLAQDEERALNGEPTRFSAGVPEKQLGRVDGKKIHKLAEDDANNLLTAARAGLDEAKARGDALALRCSSIGVNNAYRDPETDFGAWQSSFKTHYDDTKKAREAKKGGPLGPDSVSLLAWELVNFKASPGFSNHGQGMAIDFETVQNGRNLGPSSKQKRQWSRSWLYQWLVGNAHLHHFAQLPTEEWHWDHGGATASPTAGQSPATATAKPAVKPAVAAPQARAAPAEPAKAQAPAKDDARLSGRHWVDQFPTGKTLDELVDPFKSNIGAFIDTLRANRAKVSISATYRPVERAWLMHWAWLIAKGKVKYKNIASIDNPHKVDILWDHGDEASTRAAAREMVSGYKMAHIAALSSRHTERRAVDITITRLPEILKIDGQDYPIGAADATENEALWFIGEHKFSVKKLPSDPPHWSEDGK